MTDTREQIALRFPPGTRARIDALRLEHETITAVLLRALAALERSPDARLDSPLDTSSHQPDNALSERLDAIETRLDRLEAASRPASRQTSRHGSGGTGTPVLTSRQFGPEAKQRAVDLAASGASAEAIIDALLQEYGRAPSKSNLARTLKRWADEVDRARDQA